MSAGKQIAVHSALSYHHGFSYRSITDWALAGQFGAVTTIYEIAMTLAFVKKRTFSSAISLIKNVNCGTNLSI